jgi:hypothetical protein
MVIKDDQVRIWKETPVVRKYYPAIKITVFRDVSSCNQIDINIAEEPAASNFTAQEALLP